jgi:hypothetical protein
MDWTLAPLVALVLCSISPDGEIERCIHFTSKPYVTCERMAVRMRENRINDRAPWPVCIRLDAVQRSG